MARVSSNSFISVGLAVMIGGGIYALAARVTSWEHKLDAFEHKLDEVWSYPMEREVWSEVKTLNPQINIPNVSAIRREFTVGANGVLKHEAEVAAIQGGKENVN